MMILLGPFAPNHKEPTELTEPEIKKLKETAQAFGYGRTETLDRFPYNSDPCNCQPPPSFLGATWSRSTKLLRDSGKSMLER